MKNFYKLISFCVLSFVFCAFLPVGDCGMYAPAKEGAELEMKSYSDNDKLTGTTKTKIVAVRKTASGQEVEMKLESFDKKDKAVGTSSYVVSCVNGEFVIDMRSMISQEQMLSFKDMQVTVEADKLDIPANPQGGQALKNGNVKMSSVSDGPVNFNLSIAITNRKVAAIEEITVPAGTFKCVKITYDAESKMLFTIKTKAAEWYAKDVGLVKSESYNTKDKLQGYTVLAAKK